MATEETSPKPKNRLLFGGLMLVALAVCPAGWHFVVHPGEVRTNDAQINGHVHPINTRIAGTITWVNPEVEDTHFVKAGTVIAHLDPNDYQPAVNRLEGEVQASEAQQRSAVLNVPITSSAALSRLGSAIAALADAESELKVAISQKAAADAAIAQASVIHRRAENDRVRYEALVSTHEISRSEYEQRATDAKATDAALMAAQSNGISAEEKIESARQKIKERESDLRSAQTAPESIASARANVQRSAGETKRSQAALATARLDLGYTNLIAPIDGVVGRKSMEAGQRVVAGQLMLTIVPPNDVWAIANFRETQLRKMRVGQTAKIHVDTFDHDFDGTVESIGGATGSKYSSIAPDNATGNYVKVVQRIPVRLRFNNVGQHLLLIPGMSVEVSVSVER